MTSNGSTLTKCPPLERAGLLLSEIFRYPDRTIKKGQILKDVLAIYIYIYISSSKTSLAATTHRLELRRPVMSAFIQWLAQLIEHWSAVQEYEGSSSRLDQHSGS